MMLFSSARFYPADCRCSAKLAAFGTGQHRRSASKRSQVALGARPKPCVRAIRLCAVERAGAAQRAVRRTAAWC